MRQIQSPDIYLFADYREYLKAVLSKKEKRGDDVRVRTLAETTGYRSASLVSMVLNGRRELSPMAAARFADFLDLKGRRRQYFMAMTQLARANNREKRVQAQERMLNLKGSKSRGDLLELEQYRFLSTWFYPVIYVMAGMKSTRWSTSWIAERLGKGITTEQVKRTLRDLVKLKLLKREKGRYVPLNTSPVTQEDIKDMAVHRYHKNMTNLAQNALDLPLNCREFNGLTIALSERQMPQVKEMIRNFRKQLNDYLTPFEPDAEEVYQFNIHLFQLTEQRSPKGSK
jgi:uncharacterized protein (TIGR02147 family)